MMIIVQLEYEQQQLT